MEYCKITHGLEAIGKTCFGTAIHGAQSVSTCHPAIARVVEWGNFDLGVSHTLSQAWIRSNLEILLTVVFRNIKNTFS